jgi:hypothetical protein
MDPGDLHHDQPDTAFGAGLVIGDQGVVDQVVGGHRGVVPAGHDAVLQALAADRQGLNRWGKACMVDLVFLLSVGGAGSGVAGLPVDWIERVEHAGPVALVGQRVRSAPRSRRPARPR